MKYSLNNKLPKNFIIAIVGPTAVGKSSLGVELALCFNGEIISADSRQVYKGLDIGSGKIGSIEMKGVKHHLLDVASLEMDFSVSDFKEKALSKINEILKKKKVPIIVGGTGFYIDALLSGQEFPDVPPDEKLRKELNKKSKEELFEILVKKDKNRASVIDKNNKVRLIRAIEIATKVGFVPKIKNKNLKYKILYLGIKTKKEKLKEKIITRLDERLRLGLVKEVQDLISKGVKKDKLYSLGLEYRYTLLYLEKKIKKEELREILITKISQYAKRQMTWFKRNGKIIWIEI